MCARSAEHKKVSRWHTCVDTDRRALTDRRPCVHSALMRAHARSLRFKCPYFYHFGRIVCRKPGGRGGGGVVEGVGGGVDVADKAIDTSTNMRGEGGVLKGQTVLHCCDATPLRC